MKYTKFIFLFIIFFNQYEIFSQADKFPKIMYVSSKEGLNQREEPSLYSRKIGIYLFAERVIIRERGQITTIDGITDCWYKTYGDSGFCWVFGGYLTDELPLEAPVILGRWDDVNNSRQYYNFSPDHGYGEGYKETGMGVFGTWTLNGNILTLRINRAMEDQILDDPMIENVQITIINRNSIILKFSKGEAVELRRSNDTW